MVRLTPSSLRLSALPRTPLARRPISSSAPLRDQASAKASEVGSKAKEAAQQASNKASQAAEKVQSAVPSGAGGKSAGEAADKAKGAAKEAGSQLSGYADKLKEMAGPMGKKVQGMLGGYADPLIYNARFVGAVLKQVYIAESLAPPKSLNALTSSYKTLYSRVIDANYFPSLIKSGEWKKVGVYAVEAYGIFTIGEMLGRRSLVGYKLEKHGNAHH